VRYGVSGLLLVCALAVSGCADENPVQAPVLDANVGLAPPYDASLEPAAAVLALVPDDARTLTVTDFEQVRQELGAQSLNARSAPEDVADFWQRAEQELAILTPGMLRADEQRLASRYGVTQLDVAWEAHFYGPDGAETGWVLRFRDGTRMGRVARATEAARGVLSGAEVEAERYLVSSGTTDDSARSWATDPETVTMADLPASATYIARGCSPQQSGAELDELGSYALQFEGSVVTARLGEDRHDLFTRMRLGADEPAFAEAFEGGVADPRSGRIGYVMTDPAAAAQLALANELPFVSCA